ncbi:MAG: radical SAM protein [Theionarchaea archaeon]|nr:radical SAM protein [Theionarchaea archaeon]
MKNVSIVNPWQAPSYEELLYERRFYPDMKGRIWREPLVTGQILDENNWEVDYLPFSELKVSPLLDRPSVWKYFYDIICNLESNILMVSPVYNMASSYYSSSLRIARAFKETHPYGKTIFTGFHVSAVPDVCLQDEAIDVIALYDAPLIPSIIVPLVETLHRNESLRHVNGICYRENGTVRLNPPACPLADHSTLPPPKYDLLAPYFSQIGWSQLKNRVPLTLRTSYGCPNRCAYCYFNPDEWRGMRTIPPENLKAELKYLFDCFDKDKLAVLMCGDELFYSNDSHFNGICEVLKEMEVRFAEAVMDRAVTFSKQKAERVAEVSNGVFFGIETTYQKELDTVKRTQDFSSYLKGLSNARNAGLDVYISWLCGLPEQTPESTAGDFLVMVELYRKGLMSCAIPCMLIPFPWCDTYKNPSKYGMTIVDTNWDHYSEMCWYPVFYTERFTRSQIWISFILMELVGRTLSRKAKTISPFERTQEELGREMETLLEHPDKMRLTELFLEMGRITQEEMNIYGPLDESIPDRFLHNR